MSKEIERTLGTVTEKTYGITGAPVDLGVGVGGSPVAEFGFSGTAAGIAGMENSRLLDLGFQLKVSTEARMRECSR